MGFKLPNKSITSGTSVHSSALKARSKEISSAFKDMKLTKEETKGAFWGPGADVTVNPIGTEMTLDKSGQKVKLDKTKPTHKKILEARWKKGDKAAGGSLNELVAARKKHKKGSAEYAEIQNKINKALGSKKVHKATKTTKSGETKTTKPKGTTVRKSDKEVVMKGFGAQKSGTLSYADKQVEKVKIAKEKADIKGAKVSGDKVEKFQSQEEISKIRSGRDDAKTGTVFSRWWHKQRAKRKGGKKDKAMKKAAPNKDYKKGYYGV